MRGFFGGVVATLVVACAGVYVTAKFALFPMGADNAPGYLERRLAHLATDATLEREAPKQENPIPVTAASLSEGARIYEKHCSVCHGGALDSISKLRRRFSPAVPQLVTGKPHDPDNEFFWITKHGWRMTGMPSWAGILTDDQIWTVVRFILNHNKLPPEAQAAWKAAADTLPPAAVGARAPAAPQAPASKR